jgi:hypothetical protein
MYCIIYEYNLSSIKLFLFIFILLQFEEENEYSKVSTYLP